MSVTLLRTFFLKHILIISCFFFVVCGRSQTMFEAFKFSQTLKPKPAFSLSSRNSFVTNRLAQMRSVFAGLNYGDITRFGLTFNWITRDALVKAETIDAIQDLQVDTRLRMYYFAPHAQYVYFKTYRWESAIHVQMGFGESFFKYDYEGQTYRTERNWIMLYEPTMNIQFRFFKYMAVTGGVGYRLMLKNNRYVQERFTSPVYTFGFKVYFSDVYQDYIKDVDND